MSCSRWDLLFSSRQSLPSSPVSRNICEMVDRLRGQMPTGLCWDWTVSLALQLQAAPCKANHTGNARTRTQPGPGKGGRQGTLHWCHDDPPEGHALGPVTSVAMFLLSIFQNFIIHLLSVHCVSTLSKVPLYLSHAFTLLVKNSWISGYIAFLAPNVSKCKTWKSLRIRFN